MRFIVLFYFDMYHGQDNSLSYFFAFSLFFFFTIGLMLTDSYQTFHVRNKKETKKKKKKKKKKRTKKEKQKRRYTLHEKYLNLLIGPWSVFFLVQTE